MAVGLCGDFYTFGPRGVVTSDMPIRGKPFRAEYEEVHSRPAAGEVIRRHGVIYRDSAGRVRQEDVRGAEPGKPEAQETIVCIVDHEKLVAHVFDARTGEGAELDLGRALQGAGAAPSCAVPSEPQSQPQSDPIRELLGTRVIEGFPCQGLRITMGQEESESWLSTDFVMLFLEVTKCPEFQTIYRLFSIKLEEPEPSLFGAPEA